MRFFFITNFHKQATIATYQIELIFQHVVVVKVNNYNMLRKHYKAKQVRTESWLPVPRPATVLTSDEKPEPAVTIVKFQPRTYAHIHHCIQSNEINHNSQSIMTLTKEENRDCN